MSHPPRSFNIVKHRGDRTASRRRFDHPREQRKREGRTHPYTPMGTGMGDHALSIQEVVAGAGPAGRSPAAAIFAFSGDFRVLGGSRSAGRLLLTGGGLTMALSTGLDRSVPF